MNRYSEKKGEITRDQRSNHSQNRGLPDAQRIILYI